MNVLVLGGTGEARRLAAVLAAQPRYAVTSSLAGRVAEPVRPAGPVRIGGFGGVDGLVAWLRAQRTEVVVDATHPFAARMTAHAVAATAALGLPLIVLRRPGWTAGPGDRWFRVPTAAAAAALVPTLGVRPFLALGRGADLAAFVDLAAFAAAAATTGPDASCLLRAVDPPSQPLPGGWRVVLDRGPFTVDGERALLRAHGVDVLVARDSGGGAAAAKLVAARELGLPVVLLDRPPAPSAPTVTTVEAAVTRLDRLDPR